MPATFTGISSLRILEKNCEMDKWKWRNENEKKNISLCISMEKNT
jgi:hypothetical protein